MDRFAKNSMYSGVPTSILRLFSIIYVSSAASISFNVTLYENVLGNSTGLFTSLACIVWAGAIPVNNTVVKDKKAIILFFMTFLSFRSFLSHLNNIAYTYYISVSIGFLLQFPFSIIIKFCWCK